MALPLFKRSSLRGALPHSPASSCQLPVRAHEQEACVGVKAPSSHSTAPASHGFLLEQYVCQTKSWEGRLLVFGISQNALFVS